MANKKADIRAALLRGEVLSPLIALNKYRCLSLSQRVGELKDEGLKINSEKVKGAPYHIYWIEKPEGNQMELAA